MIKQKKYSEKLATTYPQTVNQSLFAPYTARSRGRVLAIGQPWFLSRREYIMPRVQITSSGRESLIAPHTYRTGRNVLGEMEAESRETYNDERTGAMNSMKEHWDGLTLFVEYPELPMDNNLMLS